MERLSRERPQANIFNFYILTSVMGQFAVHAVSLWWVVKLTREKLPADWVVDLERTEFEPNIFNTSVYLISLAMQVSTFIINYQGRPFRESLRENKPLYFSLMSLYGVSFLCASQTFPFLNKRMELVPMDKEFSQNLTLAIAADLFVCLGIEWLAHRFFVNSRPKKSLRME